MILIPDDEPELSLPAVVIPPGDEWLPALSGENAPVSPARAYLSLNSPAAGRPWPRSSVLSPACSEPLP
jgi:hypothetical protein